MIVDTGSCRDQGNGLDFSGVFRARCPSQNLCAHFCCLEICFTKIAREVHKMTVVVASILWVAVLHACYCVGKHGS